MPPAIDNCYPRSTADRADAAPTARTDTFLRFLQWTFVWFLARALFFLLAHEALIRVYLYFDFGWERDKLERLYGQDWKPVFVVNGASTIGANASWRHYKRFMGIK